MVSTIMTPKDNKKIRPMIPRAGKKEGPRKVRSFHFEKAQQQSEGLRPPLLHNRSLSARDIIEPMDATILALDSNEIGSSLLSNEQQTNPNTASRSSNKPRLANLALVCLCFIVTAVIFRKQDFDEVHVQALRVQVVDENTVQGEVERTKNGIAWIKKLPHAETLKNSTTTPTTSTVSALPPLEQNNRMIAIVHIGKNGGSTLRDFSAIDCMINKNNPPAANMTKAEIKMREKRCIDRRFREDQKLAIQTQSVFHMWAYDEEAIASSTSFLIPIRNPVERIISTYRYSHPANCNNESRLHGPYGCHVRDHLDLDKPLAEEYQLYRTCFPSPAMEAFAQSVKSPWSVRQFSPTTSVADMLRCRKLARDLVDGTFLTNAAPHMHYNYKYYTHKTLQKFPEKEVLAIRTEHEWDDLMALDRQLGGSGNYRRKENVSHGSEHYNLSPLSTQAYQKLCCVLEKEIDIYILILERSINLEESAKQESIQVLRDKCGVTSWSQWRTTCRAELEKDRKIIKD